jgi:hypothetical protein
MIDADVDGPAIRGVHCKLAAGKPLVRASRVSGGAAGSRQISTR